MGKAVALTEDPTARLQLLWQQPRAKYRHSHSGAAHCPETPSLHLSMTKDLFRQRHRCQARGAAYKQPNPVPQQLAGQGHCHL